MLSSKFQNDSATSFVFLSLNFTVFAHGLTFERVWKESIHSVPDKAKVANLFQSFHRTFQPLKRVMESGFYSVIIFYFCLYTTRNYGKTHSYICSLATPFCMMSGQVIGQNKSAESHSHTCKTVLALKIICFTTWPWLRT